MVAHSSPASAHASQDDTPAHCATGVQRPEKQSSITSGALPAAQEGGGSLHVTVRVSQLRLTTQRPAMQATSLGVT